MGFANIVGKHTGSKPIGAVVSAGNYLVFFVKNKHGHNRAKNFFAANRHAVQAIDKHRWRDKVPALAASGSQAFAPCQQAGSFSQTELNIGQHFFHMRLRYQRAQIGLRVSRITHSDTTADAQLQAGNKIRIQLALHVNAGSMGAHFALRIEVCQHSGRNGFVNIGVVKHNKRRLSAQLHGHRLEISRGIAHHFFAGLDRAGKRHLGNIRM